MPKKSCNVLIPFEFLFCKCPELMLQNYDNCYSGYKPDTSVLSNGSMCHASSIVGNTRENRILFVMCSGNVEENNINLIRFRDTLTFGCISKASKSSIRMNLYIDG